MVHASSAYLHVDLHDDLSTATAHPNLRTPVQALVSANLKALPVGCDSF